MNISQRLDALRAAMQRHSLDMYYIPTDDFHGSEYVGGYFRCREYISGFTGSAGVVIVTRDYAGLWTDGRYFLQAEAQLLGTGFILNKSGCEGVPKPEEFISKYLGDGILGFDGRTVDISFAEKIIEKIGREHLKSDIDLMSEIWTDRAALPSAEAFILDDIYSGENRSSKLARIRQYIREKGAETLIMTALDDICWTLNVRGGDIEYNPVVLSYLLVTENEAVWFVDENKLSDDVKKSLCDITIRPYENFYEYISENIKNNVCIDKKRTNFGVTAALNENVKIIYADSPAMLFKAVKNETECKNMVNAHIRDGTAVVKFIYRVKNHPEEFTELSAAALIRKLRSEQPGYISESFEPIIAYKEHGAIVHYEPTEETDVPLGREGFLLCDTGGHYLTGTTDITRTICLGKADDTMKARYTAVLRGNLNLGAAVFPAGTRGANLDILAREPLWEQMLDYNHGTGHGVGYLLNVHEGPNSIRNRIGSDVSSAGCVFEEGMITSNEPGLYITNEYGIRTENLILCRNAGENEFGKFLRFETLTVAPFDPDAVEPSLMTKREIDLYNKYQRRVYETISPFLDEDERRWLANETREISAG